MIEVTETKFNAARKIVDSGLHKAAQSLSFFMKEPIQLNETDFNITYNLNFFIKNSGEVDELYVLSTEVKGDLGGISYLVFSKEEKDEICKVALSHDIHTDLGILHKMQEPLLLEIDNIITASVITQIANRLDLNIHGDVPKLAVMNSTNLIETIQQSMIPDKLIMGFQTEFTSDKSHFHPEFLWIMEPSFLEYVSKNEQ